MSWCDEHECPYFHCEHGHTGGRRYGTGGVALRPPPTYTASMTTPKPASKTPELAFPWLRLVFAFALGFWLCRSCTEPEPVPANACQCAHPENPAR